MPPAPAGASRGLMVVLPASGDLELPPCRGYFDLFFASWMGASRDRGKFREEEGSIPGAAEGWGVRAAMVLSPLATPAAWRGPRWRACGRRSRWPWAPQVFPQNLDDFYAENS